MAEHYAQMRQAQVLAARAIVRRGIDRGELAPGTSVTLLLDTLIGGAMMHAMVTPDERRADLARNTGRLRRPAGQLPAPRRHPGLTASPARVMIPGGPGHMSRDSGTGKAPS